MNRIVGALWKREKDGREYYSGILKDLHGDINIAVFPNTYKQAQNQPDGGSSPSGGSGENKRKDRKTPFFVYKVGKARISPTLVKRITFTGV